MMFDADLSGAEAAALWSGLLVLLLVVLSIRVMVTRRRARVALGDGGHPQLILSGRVFGNAVEYVPLGIGAMAVLAVLGMPAIGIHMVGGPLFAGRLFHAAGLSDRGATLGRVVGMTLTWIALLIAGLMLVVHAFVAPH